jgi:glycosyltransferase involved in cell wall biosynthesis
LSLIEVTILMPNLNEAETIGTCIGKAKSFLENSGVSGEIVVADNGSTDGSQDIARENGARVILVPSKGYGEALIAGINASRGQFVIMGDADESYDFSNLMPFIVELRKGSELVIGNRFKGGISKNAMPPLHRYLGNPVLSLIGRVFYRTSVGDFHCGLRGFSRTAILGLKLNSPGMEFASEMILKASLMGLNITEVPTTLRPDGRTRPPHLRSWRDGWRHLKILLSFAPHWLFLYPGVALCALGVLVFLALIGGALTIAGVRFDIAALMLASALLLTGAQMVIFFGLARLYAIKHRNVPTAPGFERMRRLISVNGASMAGGIFVALGIISAVSSTLYWYWNGFGDLEPGVIARLASLAVVGSSLGIQMITGGFLWGIINEEL